MKRTIRFFICAALFLSLTCVKLVSPSAAVLVRDTILPVLDQDDDFSKLQEILKEKRPVIIGSYTHAVPPIDQTKACLEQLHHEYFQELPTAQSPNPTPTPTPDPKLLAAETAKEAFLESQAAFADYDLPKNVSYDILSLPFDETSPVDLCTSSGFGYRLHPIDDVVKFHYGTDFAAGEGTEILAFADGTVLAAGEDDGYGNYVKLDHGDGYVTLYGHCSTLLVHEGENITKGQPIALVGATGHATGPHLHFELIHNGIYLNPEFYLAA